MKKKDLFKLIVISGIILLCGCAVLIGIQYVKNGGVTYNDEFPNTYLVGGDVDESILVKNNSSLYNDEIKLKGNLTISELEQIGTKELPFNGVLNGNGFTITMDTDHALFGYIGERAIIRNVKIVYENTSLSENINEFSVLGVNNSGNISDVHLQIKQLNITKCTNLKYGSMVITNYGKINQCFVEYSLVNDTNTYKEDVLIGGVVYQNLGEISNVIVNPKFTNFPQILFGSQNETNIGVVVYLFVKKQKVANCYSIYNTGEYKFKDRKDNAGSNLDIKATVKLTRENIESLKFNEDLWDFNLDTFFPKLIQGEERRD